MFVLRNDNAAVNAGRNVRRRLINAEGIALWANVSACRLLNASRERLPGKQITAAFPALNGDILEKALSDENEAYAVARLSGKREIIVNAVSAVCPASSIERP